MDLIYMRNVKFRFLIFAIVAIFSCFQVAFAQTGSLNVIQLSDIHLSFLKVDKASRMTANSDKLFDDALNYIKSKNDIDYIFVTGDAIDTPNERLARFFVSKMNALNIPYIWAFGNHDVSNLKKFNSLNLISVLKKDDPYQKADKSFFEFDLKSGFSGLVLNPVTEDTHFSDGFVSKEQLCFLKDSLENLNKNPQVDAIIILTHHPLLPPIEGSDHAIENQDEVLKVLEIAQKPVFVFQGHYHMPKIERKNNILFISSAALIQYPNAFREVNFQNNDKNIVVSVKFVETNLKDLQQKSKKFLNNLKFYEGDENSRNATFVFDK